MFQKMIEHAESFPKWKK